MYYNVCIQYEWKGEGQFVILSGLMNNPVLWPKSLIIGENIDYRQNIDWQYYKKYNKN